MKKTFFFHDFEKKNLVDEVWDIFEKVEISRKYSKISTLYWESLGPSLDIFCRRLDSLRRVYKNTMFIRNGTVIELY